MHRQVKFFLFLFVGVSGLMLFYFTRSSSNIVVEEGRNFSINSIADIDSVLLLQDHKKLKLSLFNDQWKVNEKNLVKQGKGEAWETILTQQKVKFMAPASAQDSLKHQLLHTGTHVQVYSKGRLINSYWVSNNAIDSTAVYAMESDATPVFAIYVLGEKIPFTSFYTSNEGEWRSLVLWDLKLEKWENFTFSSQADTSLNYHLKISSSNIELENRKDGAAIPTNYSSILEFLNDNNLKMAKAFVGTKLPDSQLTPMFELVLANSADTMVYKAFKKPAAPNAKDLLGLPLEFDNEVFYLQREEEVFLADYFSFEQVLKGRKAFQ